MFIENIKLTFQNLRSNKLRSILSLLGIVIGVSSVIMITTLGKSGTSGIKGEIASAGLETITLYKGWGKKSVDHIFTLELGNNLTRDIKGLENAIPVSEDQFIISSRNKSGDFNVRAVSEEYAIINSIELEAGEFLTANDNEKRRQSIVLGAELATKLFPSGHAVGKSIRLIQWDSRTFRVVGIMKPKSSSMGGSFNDYAYIPYNTYSKKINRLNSVNMFLLKVNKGSNPVAVSEKVKQYLFDLTGDKDSFYVESPSSMLEMFSKISNTLNLVLGGIAAISLLVGGIGIMNIMIVSVTERTKEIGIRKALGASPKIIKGQFLTEAITLTMTGGIIGTILGSGISRIITTILKWSFSPDLKAYVVAVLFSSLIGIFFGFYPAACAAKMDPIKALNYE